MSVEAINRSLGVVLMTSGTIVPVTDWINEDGETCSPDEAVCAVAGPSSDGRWHTLLLSEYDEVKEQ